MTYAYYFTLRSLEKLVLSDIAAATVEEIERLLPGVIERHPDKVCAIIKQVVKRKADEDSAAKSAEWRRVSKAARDAEKAVKDAKCQAFEDSIASFPPAEQIIKRIYGPRFN